MDPITLAILGAGLLKGHQDVSNYQRQQELEATREKWSPWTGVHGQNLQAPSALAPAMQAAMAAAMWNQANPSGAGKVSTVGGVSDNSPYQLPQTPGSMGRNPLFGNPYATMNA